jgi:monoamine oxidase
MATGQRGRDVEADVVVVGAGLAGLTAARTLAAGGLEPVVLEARDRVGGRTLNEPLGDGKVVEIGGQWVGPTQRRVTALAREVGVSTFPTHDHGDHVIEFEGKRARHRGTIPRLRWTVMLDTAQALARLERMARQVPLDAPWRARRAERWDGETLATWMRRHMRTAGGRTLLEMATQAVWAVEPADLSLLHMLFYTHSAGGLSSMLETEGGAQQDRFVGGSQLVSIRVAEELGERVALDAPVRSIEHGDRGVLVKSDGVTARGRRAIVAVPPALAGRIEYDPPLPGHRDQLTQRMPQGAVIKCVAVYERPFWREQGLSGQGTSDAGPVRMTFDNSPPDGEPGALVGFLEGRFARELGRAPAERRREAVLGCFERLFGAAASRPQRYIERVWADERWTRGCYGCYMAPGGWTAYGSALRPPVGAIHWASAETATVWNGYMDGAVQSGERAAAEVLEASAA